MSFFGLIPTCLVACGAILKNITIKLIQLWFGRSRKEHFWKIGDPFITTFGHTASQANITGDLRLGEWSVAVAYYSHQGWL